MFKFDEDDKNAQAAFEKAVERAWETDKREERWHYGDHDYKTWAEVPEDRKRLRRQEMRRERLKHFMTQDQAMTAAKDGTFVCMEGYAFKTVVDKSKTYKIYRCDGGHHYGVVYTEYKEREGSTGHERKLVIKNGELVEEDVQASRNDQLELD